MERILGQKEGYVFVCIGAVLMLNRTAHARVGRIMQTDVGRNDDRYIYKLCDLVEGAKAWRGITAR